MAVEMLRFLLIFGIITPKNIRSSSATNLFLNQLTKAICDDAFRVSEVTDGNKEPDKDVSFINNCGAKEFRIEIKLAQPQVVHYVAVYAGNSTVLGNHALDYFGVMLHGESNTTICGVFHGQWLHAGEMLVNCQNEFFLSSSVEIINRRNPYMENASVNIAEIEGHSLGTPYIGCFPDTIPFTNSTVELENCTLNCFLENKAFALIKNGEKCRCATEIRTVPLPIETCDMICDGVDDGCGGANAFSVYAATVQLPYFIGCYVIPNSFDIAQLFDPLYNALDCIINCEESQYFYMFIKKYCYCMSTKLTTPPTFDGCDTPCIDGPDHFCGGEADYFSHYAGCQKIACSTLFKCRGHYFDAYARCEEGCLKGWTGSHCLHHVKKEPLIDPEYKIGLIVTISILLFTSMLSLSIYRLFILSKRKQKAPKVEGNKNLDTKKGPKGPKVEENKNLGTNTDDTNQSLKE